MVHAIAHARVTDIIYAQLTQGADLYQEILEICRTQDIKTGYVLNIVGGLTKARLSTPVGKLDAVSPPGIREFEGTMEAAGIGILGQTIGTYDAEKVSGIINRAGEPYAHVHLTISGGGETHMGHLIDGCIVRSLHTQSHFTIAIAKTEGAQLNFNVSKETTPKYPKGIPIHELHQL